MADKQAERDRIAADVARFTGTVQVIPPGVSGDTYIDRMNAHGRAQKAECQAAARRRGAKNANAAMAW